MRKSLAGILSLLLLSLIITGCNATKAFNETMHEVKSAIDKTDNDNYIQYVKGFVPTSISNSSYGEAFDVFFDNPSWEYHKADIGVDIVEFKGNAYQDGELKEVVAQFQFDIISDSMFIRAMTVGGELQSDAEILAMVTAVFHEFDDGSVYTNDSSEMLETDYTVEKSHKNPENPYDSILNLPGIISHRYTLGNVLSAIDPMEEVGEFIEHGPQPQDISSYIGYGYDNEISIMFIGEGSLDEHEYLSEVVIAIAADPQFEFSLNSQLEPWLPFNYIVDEIGFENMIVNFDMDDVYVSAVVEYPNQGYYIEFQWFSDPYQDDPADMIIVYAMM